MRNFVVIALLIIVGLAMLPTATMAKDLVNFQIFPTKANLWYFHSPEKGLNFYFMKTWPNSGFLLTKFGPPAYKLGKAGTIQVAVGPDLDLAAKSTKDLISSWTMDVTPVLSAYGFLAVFVNEAGINKDGKGIWFLRHTVSRNGFGLRWSGCGQFGKEATFFQIGPTVQFKAIQLWMAWDTINDGWTGEISFNVKL